MVWGGRRMESILNKKLPVQKKIGESWELSGVQGNLSKITNGKLQGNTIEEVIEIFMGDIVGDRLYEQFGVEFPLLIKFIDSSDNLSVQVHPDDEVAQAKHHAYGKTEMWYVIDAEPGAELIVGFNRKIDSNQYRELLQENSLQSTLNKLPVKKGDVFFIPAGRIHAIGKGIVLAEIQQTSDITYRIYDWGRDLPNRPLHVDLAADVIDFTCYDEYKTKYDTTPDSVHKMVTCQYFTTSYINFSKPITRDLSTIDSFVIYICTAGACTVLCENGTSEKLTIGETLLLPAAIKDRVEITPFEASTLLEIYV